MNESMKKIIAWADSCNISKNIIPRNDSRLQEIEEIILSSSDLLNLTPEIASLAHLTDLWLGYNYLEVVPKELGELKSLKRISLSNNKLTVLPNEIINLKDLELLALDNNPLKLTQEQIKWITHLKDNGCVISIDKDVIDIDNVEYPETAHINSMTHSKQLSLKDRVIAFLAEVSYVELVDRIEKDGIEIHIDYLLNTCVKFKNNTLIADLLNDITASNAYVCEIYFDENEESSLNRRKFFYTTLLHYGIKEQEIKIVKPLLYNQNNIDVVDEKDRTPLGLALGLKATEIVLLLMKSKVYIPMKHSSKYMEDAIKNKDTSFLKYAISIHSFAQEDYKRFLYASLYEDYLEGYQLFVSLLDIDLDKEHISEALHSHKLHILQYLMTKNIEIKPADYFNFLNDFYCAGGRRLFDTSYDYSDDINILQIYIQFGLKHNCFNNCENFEESSLLLYAIKKEKVCLVEFILANDGIHNQCIMDLSKEYGQAMVDILRALQAIFDNK